MNRFEESMIKASRRLESIDRPCTMKCSESSVGEDVVKICLPVISAIVIILSYVM